MVSRLLQTHLEVNLSQMKYMNTLQIYLYQNQYPILLLLRIAESKVYLKTKAMFVEGSIFCCGYILSSCELLPADL